MIKRIKISSEEAGPKLNIKKARVMITGEQENVVIGGKQ
jgi:hypothetical protein